jgi:hypothetical protein
VDGSGDSIQPAEVDEVIPIGVQDGILELPFAIVSEQRGNAVRVNLPVKLTVGF